MAARNATFGRRILAIRQEYDLDAHPSPNCSSAAPPLRSPALAEPCCGAWPLPRPGGNAPTPTRPILAKAGPDGDVVLGSDKAPVTIIEYASMTCPHCAHFSTTTFPELQKRYIDTGKVRFIFREFPLDALAAAGFMLARCAGKDKFMPMVETLFAKQPEWMVQKPIEPLAEIAKQFGFTQQTFDAVPGESEGARRHPGGARPRRRRSSESTPPRPFSSTARSSPATCRSTRWPRKSTPISRKDKGFLPFWASPRRCGLSGPAQAATESWITRRTCCACGRADSFSAPMRHTSTQP